MSETIEEPVEVGPEGNGSDRIKPWTIKGIAPEERNAAIAAAERGDMTIGEWLTRAIRTQVQADREVNRAPVPVSQIEPRVDRKSDLEAIERMIALASQIAETNKTTIPRSITRGAHSLMREHLDSLKAGRTNRGNGSDRRQ